MMMMIIIIMIMIITSAWVLIIDRSFNDVSSPRKGHRVPQIVVQRLTLTFLSNVFYTFATFSLSLIFIVFERMRTLLLGCAEFNWDNWKYIEALTRNKEHTIFMTT